MSRYLSETKRPIIDEALAKELRDFKGQWVAVDVKGNKVAGSGASASEALNAAVKRGITDPIVFRVSTNLRRLRI